ncbi:MAG TPA: hypothetical protein PLO07_16865, partial [Rubrivivax sp.]|nr:hypothetical protein [Rubrivivax sp.]
MPRTYSAAQLLSHEQWLARKAHQVPHRVENTRACTDPNDVLFRRTSTSPPVSGGLLFLPRAGLQRASFLATRRSAAGFFSCH